MEKMQFFIGQLLRIGVIISFVVVLVGGGIYLFQHGSENFLAQPFMTTPPAPENIFIKFYIFRPKDSFN